jgi:hypothetical protein
VRVEAGFQQAAAQHLRRADLPAELAPHRHQLAQVLQPAPQPDLTWPASR